MDTEDMNLIKYDPASSKLRKPYILRDLDQKLLHLDPVQRKELKQLNHEYDTYFRTLLQGLTKLSRCEC